jgi:large subunit ribosomal protein L10
VPTQAKVEAVDLLADKFERSTILITTDYSGLPVGEMTMLRRALREAGVEYRIIKNTLAYLAADKVGRPAIKDVIEGPTGVAFGYGEPTEPAKALSGFIRSSRSSLKIRGGELDGRVLSTEDVGRLATMPNREELIAILLMRMNGPIGGLVNVLNGPIAGLARVLQGHVDNLQQQES